MNDDRAQQLLKEAEFKYAKTMPKNPHHYTLRTTWDSNDDFNAVVLYIREYGVRERFFKMHFCYYYLDGFKYWTMGWPARETTLINRAKVNPDRMLDPKLPVQANG